MTHPHDHNPPGSDGHVPLNRMKAHLENGASPDEIKEDINHTREAMDHTLDELAERLRPRHWVDEITALVTGGGTSARETAREVGEAGLEHAREAAHKAACVVKQHPVPTALLVGGLAWFIAEQATGRRASLPRTRRHPDPIERDRLNEDPSDEWGTGPATPPSHSSGAGLPPVIGPQRGSVTGRPVTVRPPHSADPDPMRRSAGPARSPESATHHAETDLSATTRAKDHLKKIGADMTQQIHEMKTEAADTAEDIKSRAAETAYEARQRAGEVAYKAKAKARYAGHRISKTASETADRAADLASHAADRVSHTAHVAKERGRETVQSHPLAVGAAMLGLGLLVGLAIPTSRREDRWFGEESDEVKDRARRMGEDVVERGKEVAHKTAEAAKEEARRQGLTPEALKESVEEVASTAASKAEREAKQQGLNTGSPAEPPARRDPVGRVNPG